MMFSATWPDSVRALSRDLMLSPVELRVGVAAGDELRANADVEQQVTFVDNDQDRENQLVRLLRGRPHAKTIVFVGMKRTCRELCRLIRAKAPGRCEALHGDRSQEERQEALEAFRSGQTRILCATDVCGRGLDVKDVALVVNFDPASIYYVSLFST